MLINGVGTVWFPIGVRGNRCPCWPGRGHAGRTSQGFTPPQGCWSRPSRSKI